jgi:hypothetical protein
MMVQCLLPLVFCIVAPAGPAIATAAIDAISVDPPRMQLDRPSASYSILVDGHTHAGRTIDLTHEAVYRSVTPETVAVSPRGVVTGVGDGTGRIEVTAASKTVAVDVTVTGTDRPRAYHFANDVAPLLGRFGCNTSACHGKAEGQNGFKLSVFGYDTAADFDALTTESRGRRVFPAAPDHSLVLIKATGDVPHGGGRRIEPGSRAYETLRGWIASGLPQGAPDAPTVVGIELAPRERTLATSSRQQLRVVARYSDGRRADVTALAKFQSNNEGVAAVDENGLVSVAEIPGQAAVMANYMGAVDVFRVLVPRNEPLEQTTERVENNFIDRLVYDHLGKLNITPSGPADDAAFLRRVYIDVIGTLPTADEARRFLDDARPDRRTRLVNGLLDRPEYATYWALKWADLLRVDRSALEHKAAYAYYRWIRESLAENKPLDRFVHDIISAEGPLVDAPQGALFKVIKKPGELAAATSQVFLGVRIDCAECHHHPFDRWSQTDYYGMQAFFTQVAAKSSPRGEVLTTVGDPETKHPRSGDVVHAHVLGADMPDRSPQGDRRRALADWMTAPDNPWFARNLANRMWAHFTGRGLVEPIDDMRATNPPTNPALLDALTDHLIDSKFDAQAMIRVICGSHIYQLSSRPNATNRRDEQNYSRALFRPMDAEVLLDAVCRVTGVDEKFTGVPAGYRAIELWDNQVGHDFLRLFGRPMRQSPCSCERISEPSVGQVLHLMNSPRVNAKLAHESGTVARLTREMPDDDRLIETLYLTAFARFPTDAERAAATAFLDGAAGGRREAVADLTWSLINTLEFTFNH